MNTEHLDIYRDLYKETLADIWDKATYALEERGLEHAAAEYAGLLITEWIRATWGGLMISERHIGDPKPRREERETRCEETMDLDLTASPAPRTSDLDPLHGSRFGALRDHALSVLAETAPGLADHPAVALEIVAIIRRDYRGHYIPRIKRLNQLQRDQGIWRQATSAARMEQLAIEHKISVVRAYQISKDMQKRKDKRDQPLLPLFNTNS